ncbi:MAG: hypothetical protein MI861_11180 [Pirellulales bacterium]|nr:hypothetical protein [Pirellulales bacterium]
MRGDFEVVDFFAALRLADDFLVASLLLEGLPEVDLPEVDLLEEDFDEDFDERVLLEPRVDVDFDRDDEAPDRFSASCFR